MATKTQVAELIQQLCESKQTCWVLVACGDADASGDMPVELYFDGDAGLACTLLEDARKVLLRELEAPESTLKET